MIAGRYSLDREVGRGGMGAVWLGTDEVLGRLVALKRVGSVPAGGPAPDFDRAAREARLAARLNHPHVVAVFDLLAEDDEHWLVMEYVEGSTLAQLVRDRGRLAPGDAAPILAQVADALAAAHAAGIVHRDVKPSNILVTAEGQVKLSDFGIARAEADVTLTQTGLVTGSPAYLAPEVATGRPATEASDMWSLGATLFHALAGHPPYEVGDNILGTLYRIVHEEPPQLPDAEWLAPLLGATMAPDPDDRWPAVHVRDFLTAGPGAAPPAVPGRSERSGAPREEGTQVLSRPVPAAGGPSQRPDRRHRAGGLLPLFVGVAVVALLTVVAFAIAQGGDGGDDPPAAGQSPSGTTSEPESPSPTAPTAEGMRTFVTDYLHTAADDPRAGFDMLTPSFQEASDGYEGYEGFWGDVERVSDIEVTQADVSSMTVAYTYRYQVGSDPPITEDVQLRLAYEGGRYLIADEA